MQLNDELSWGKCIISSREHVTYPQINSFLALCPVIQPVCVFFLFAGTLFKQCKYLAIFHDNHYRWDHKHLLWHPFLTYNYFVHFTHSFILFLFGSLIDGFMRMIRNRSIKCTLYRNVNDLTESKRENFESRSYLGLFTNSTN